MTFPGAYIARNSLVLLFCILIALCCVVVCKIFLMNAKSLELFFLTTHFETSGHSYCAVYLSVTEPCPEPEISCI